MYEQRNSDKWSELRRVVNSTCRVHAPLQCSGLSELKRVVIGEPTFYARQAIWQGSMVGQGPSRRPDRSPYAP